MGSSVFARAFSHSRFFAVLLCMLALSPNSYAFKPDTHVWIGQQVLNDVVPDGRVTINGREYPVPQHIWYALRSNPSQYRMGTIGPDAFPDIMAGQMSVHPGSRDATGEVMVGDNPKPWRADDWFQWLLSSANPNDAERVAFSYGYMAHAASDIFAHSYVNTYTGDVFWLTGDGEANEQEAELRHITLESYIAAFNPPLLDHSGVDLGPASANVASPARFIRDRLIFNDDVKAQYDLQMYTKHLAAMYKLYLAVGHVRERLYDIDGVKIPQHLAELAGRAATIQGKIDQLVAEIERLQNEILVKTSLINLNLQLIDEKKALIQLKVQEIDALSRLLAEIAQVVEQRNAIVNNLQNQLANTVKETCNTICENTPPGCGRFPRPPCSPLCKLICELTSAWIEINNQLQGAILERDAIVAEYNARLFDKTVAEQTKTEAEIAIAALEAENKILQEQIDLARDLLATDQAAREQARADLLAVLNDIATTERVQQAEVYVLRTMFDHWYRDLDLASEAYVVAWGDFGKKIMDGTGDRMQPLFGPNGSITNGVGDSAITPVKHWLDCWGPVFTGVPKEIPNTVCRIGDSIDRVTRAISELQRAVNNALGPLAWLVDPVNELNEKVMQELEPTLVDTTLEVTTKVLGEQMADIMRLVYFGANADTLNQVFAHDSSPKHLMLIPDIATRVNAEMHITPQGHFDPNRYRVVQNAVLLSKLALLEPWVLNRIAADNTPGLTSTVYGPTLYPEVSTPETVFNILIGAVNSIDGNQQWQQLGLPYHRQSGYVDPQWPWTGPLTNTTKRSYGYGFQNGALGLRFWEDPTTRESLFRNQTTALFKGPLAPGIEYPLEFGLSRLIPNSYPYRSCPQNPFPRTTNIDGSFLTDVTGTRRDPGCDEDLVVSINAQLQRNLLVVDFTVTNAGDNVAAHAPVAFYLSADATLDASDVLLLQREVRGLAAGQSFGGTIRHPVQRIAAGNYYILGVVDPANQVAEARENNNVIVAPITIQ